MHAAPAVRMDLMPDRAWHAVVALCAGGAGANLAAWGALHAQAPLPVVTAVAMSAAAVAALWGWRTVRRLGPGTGALAWDGTSWQWSAPGTAPVSGAVRVAIDLGPWLLLRFERQLPASRMAWLAASRRMAGASWPAWRAALYSRRPGQQPPSAAELP